MKKVFKGDEDEDPELISEAEEVYFIPQLLNKTSMSLMKYITQKSICPILTDQKFNYLL